MNEVQYQASMGLAQKFYDAGEFAEAGKAYRKAFRDAAPQEMQTIIDRIRDAKEKAAIAPKKDKTEVARNELGFVKYSTKFVDVIGYNRHKKLVRRIIERPTKPGNLYSWFKMPKSTGILLYGPPGTGKTLFAKAISGEFDIPMKDIFISDILGRLVGESEKNMKKAFDDAKQCQPSILFFDELDALGGERESANSFTNNDIKNTVNEFMKEISELRDNKETKVFVIGATNLPWLIDEAIKRSGRLEHRIYLGPPTFFDRRKLFRYYLELGKEGGFGKSISLSLLALATIRYSQADIASVCYDSFKVAEEKGNKYVTMHDVQKMIRERKSECLDAWYLKAKQTYITNEKTIVHRTGLLGWRRQKEKVIEQGKMSKDDQKNYRPLINNVKSNVRWWLFANVIRFAAQWV